MESVSIKDPSGIGKWVLISGYPFVEKHSLFNPVQKLFGPTFSVFVYCEFQEGKNFKFFDAIGEFPAYPELLRCGYSPKK